MKVRKRLCTVPCVGHVIRRSRIGNSCLYNVTVMYEVNGKSFKITEVTRMRWKRIAIGGISLRTLKVYSNPDMVTSRDVTVMYNPASPKEAHIKNNSGIL